MRSDSSSSLVTETGILIKRLDPETARKCVNQYQFLKELGRGTHGKVKLAVDMTDQSLWAVKIIPRQPRRKLTAFNSLSQNHSNQIKREVAIMKKVNHPAIVKVRELIDAPNSDKIFLVLEYLSGGEIIWDQHPLASQDCIHIFRKLVQGVNYLHSQGIIHRDIKPANLLKDSHNQIKISDFSVSLIYDECDQVEIAKAAGSPAFLAPEICGVSEGDSDSEDIIIDPFAIDIWAMGVTLYCLAFGTLPFNGDNEFEVYHAVNNQP
jgi:[calcium/calmodulin-dependent protein kinase] kinase